MKVLDRFMGYIKVDTASNEQSESCPSTPGQKVFGAALVEELKALGLDDARMDEHGYVYASIPATDPRMETIGLIAHMDTVRDVPSTPMNARIIEHYDGRDVTLNDEGELLSIAQFPFLKKYAGQTLVVTDGKTILGADDKAGIAQIITAAEEILRHPELQHGKIALAFTPDEEIGRGADKFDVQGFGAAYAYTVDGGELGELEYETFNASSLTVEVKGVNIHPGTAKDKMKNAQLIGMEFHQMLPAAQRPEHTQGYEGFFLLTSMSGRVEECRMNYIVRDHDKQAFEEKKALAEKIALFLNEKHGAGTVAVTLKDSYYNMSEVLASRLEIVERAKNAMIKAGVTPKVGPVRGGTDGARLSFMGLPCPNLSTGGMNYHGRHECVVVESMEKMVQVLVNLTCA